MITKKIVTCSGSDDLHCFLNVAKGNRCYHWGDHVWVGSCEQKYCEREEGKFEVKCIENKEEKNNESN